MIKLSQRINESNQESEEMKQFFLDNFKKSTYNNMVGVYKDYMKARKIANDFLEKFDWELPDYVKTDQNTEKKRIKAKGEEFIDYIMLLENEDEARVELDKILKSKLGRDWKNISEKHKSNMEEIIDIFSTKYPAIKIIKYKPAHYKQFETLIFNLVK